MNRRPVYSFYLKVLIHVLFWTMLFVLLNYRWFWGSSGHVSSNAPYRSLINGSFLIAFFYLNALFLFPAYYRKSIMVYAVTVMACAVLFAAAADWLNNFLMPFKYFKEGRLYFALIPYLFIWGISTSFRIISDSARSERLLKEKENESLKSELLFLRSQVSPHFMFNVLNSMVSLARKKSDLMEPSLIQLSGLMRYMLYDSDSEKISLEQEVDYLRSYIDLQLLRFGDDLDLKFDASGDTGTFEIEPMLLISLVENAFKHGLGINDEPFIRISLHVEGKSRLLTFRVENSVPRMQGAKDKSSGIGLQNVRRRLELLYANAYELKCSQENGTFISQLIISLK